MINIHHNYTLLSSDVQSVFYQIKSVNYVHNWCHANFLDKQKFQYQYADFLASITGNHIIQIQHSKEQTYVCFRIWFCVSSL